MISKHDMIMLLFGENLNENGMNKFKMYLYDNKDVDLYEFYFLTVSLGQFDAAKIIFELGFDMNADVYKMGEELFSCAQDSTSKDSIDYFLDNGLIITPDLLNEILDISILNSQFYKIEKSYSLILELSKHLIKK